jgi:N4-gp56 family major capsid protein
MLNYNAPAAGQQSDIDNGAEQMNTFQWLRKAIVTSRKEQFFMPLATVTNMPKHFGKAIKLHEYIPLLDVRNINDQGIDAAGAVILSTNWVVSFPATVMSVANASKVAVAAAINDDIANSVTATAGADNSASAGFATITLSGFTGAVNTGRYLVGPKNTVLSLVTGATAEQLSGNLYGSSKDIGNITGKLPVLTENGGRVNRVGFTRIQREGTISKFGFFTEFTQEALDFDSDDMLMDHLSRELMTGAVQLTEAVLQRDILAAAGVTLFSGAAVSNATVTGEVVAAVPGVSPEIPASIPSYRNFMRLDQILTDNRTPKQTTVITGSRNVDTKTIPAGRIMFIGSELVTVVKAMTDLFGERAFIPVQHYASAGTVLNGEIGMVDSFHIVVVPEMLHWAGVGALVGTNPGYRTSNSTTGERYNVYPMLVIGDDSFTTIGFQTDGKSVKFSVLTKMPGKETAHATSDPFGETGFSSIKWYYGFLVKRPERIAVIKAVAPI